MSPYKNELITEGCVPLKGRRLTLTISDACRKVDTARDDHIEWIKAVIERHMFSVIYSSWILASHIKACMYI